MKVCFNMPYTLTMRPATLPQARFGEDKTINKKTNPFSGSSPKEIALYPIKKVYAILNIHPDSRTPEQQEWVQNAQKAYALNGGLDEDGGLTKELQNAIKRIEKTSKLVTPWGYPKWPLYIFKPTP